jgi:hypothetical protein
LRGQWHSREGRQKSLIAFVDKRAAFRIKNWRVRESRGKLTGKATGERHLLKFDKTRVCNI